MSTGPKLDCLRVLIAEPDDFNPAAKELLSRHVEVVMKSTSPAELQAAFLAYDAVWIRLKFRISSDAIGPKPRTQVLACPATGLDHIDLDACRDRGIQVVSLKGETAFLKSVRATAELTVGLMLSLLRKLPVASQSVLAGTWNRDLFRGRELHEKTVGLVGMGRLGSVVAHMLRGFDVRTIGYDPREDFPSELVARSDSLEHLLSESDVVSLHVSYDASTRHLISGPQLSAMREHAVLVNTSRSGIVDEAALLSALTDGSISGAALDVLEGEPNPDLQTNPLVDYARSHDNLIIVPHIGGNTWESTQKTELFIANKLLQGLGVPVGAEP